ncbi:MAG: hypothetical protein BLM47_13290 [Candidatus Reconcilbacillus cellulovorans]|uniref:Uncharacterized protein n=1 Tax=Candidatus Reconcilbacillus cellulovorans TaxID=1906605 RepID=A0A2A6DX54_9BACL|nr:MAG: hypothetical protein BLM47_13290 [Candidatus Reconcilbacillus cellulovorans]
MRLRMRKGTISALFGLAAAAAGALCWMRNRTLASSMLGWGAAQTLLGILELASRRNRTGQDVGARPFAHVFQKAFNWR